MKKLAKVFLSFMLVFMCLFSFIGCSGNNNNNNGNETGNSGGSSESIDGTYYFNDVIFKDQEYLENNPGLEATIYSGYYNVIYVIEDGKLIEKDSRYPSEVLNVTDFEKEGENFKATTINPENPDETFSFYFQISNGVLTLPLLEGVDFQFVKDRSKHTKEYEYRLYQIESSTGASIDYSDNILADFINIDENILTRYMGNPSLSNPNIYSFKYTMTKEGDDFKLTGLAEIEDDNFDGQILKISGDTLEITIYSDNDYRKMIYKKF